MNRRDFIKNSLLLCGCSCLAGGTKILYDNNSQDHYYDVIKLKKEYLVEEYKDKSELPRKIRLDACTLCQLNCARCFMRRDPEGVKKGCGLGYLSFENFKKLVDDNNIREIELSQNGEIFLNPDLGDIIKYGHKKNIILTVDTGANLNYLPNSIAEDLVKYKLHRLTVSIDAASPEIYQIYRRGGDFNTVINNIKKINYFKKKYNSVFPMLTYKFILFGHNENEINKAKELAKKLNMYIFFELNYDRSYSPVQNVELVKRKTGVNTNIELFESVIRNYQKCNNKWYFCKELWSAPQINWDGKILGCRNNYNSDFGGNAFKDGLLNALNHPKVIYAKNMITYNAKPIKGIPCTKCDSLWAMKRHTNMIIKSPKRNQNLLSGLDIS